VGGVAHRVCYRVRPTVKAEKGLERAHYVSIQGDVRHIEVWRPFADKAVVPKCAEGYGSLGSAVLQGLPARSWRGDKDADAGV